MVFVLFIATDIGTGKINTGVEFEEKPKSIKDIVALSEQLYTKEKQMQLNDQRAQFLCGCVLLRNTGIWTEIRDVNAIDHKSQLFLFDWNGVPPRPSSADVPAGTIPNVQFFVKARQLRKAMDSSTSAGSSSGASTLMYSTDASSSTAPPPPASSNSNNKLNQSNSFNNNTRASHHPSMKSAALAASASRRFRQPGRPGDPDTAGTPNSRIEPSPSSSSFSQRPQQQQPAPITDGRSNTNTVNNNRFSNSTNNSLLSSGAVNTPRPAGVVAGGQPSSHQQPARSSSMIGAPLQQPQQQQRPDEAPQPPFVQGFSTQAGNPHLTSQLPQEALDFLFAQISKASQQDIPPSFKTKDSNTTNNGATKELISSQRLHSICMENELTIGTDTFSVMVHHKGILSYDDWHTLVEEYGPFVDALYDRLCSKHEEFSPPQMRRVKNDIDRLKEHINALEDEEQELITRQAMLKQEMLEAKRRLKEAESALVIEEKAAKPDRSKETEMIKKFVSLRVRQVHLQDEEAKVNHELSLL